MATKTEEEKSLAAKIREREQLVRKIVKFSLRLIAARGKVTTNDVRDSHTHVVREFTIGELRFVEDAGQSMMGGNNLYIEFQGRKVFDLTNRSATFKKGVAEKLYWDNARDDWFQEITKLLAVGSNRLIQKLASEAVAKKRKAEQEAAAAEKLNKLKTKARKLAIEV
ncbi:hypothetical protein KW784_02365 [Candidatus Parcubacteria bacterium]|nr:hypothetical protein [Candidatus Parcubacteria bacterium]